MSVHSKLSAGHSNGQDPLTIRERNIINETFEPEALVKYTATATASKDAWKKSAAAPACTHRRKSNLACNRARKIHLQTTFQATAVCSTCHGLNTPVPYLTRNQHQFPPMSTDMSPRTIMKFKEA